MDVEKEFDELMGRNSNGNGEADQEQPLIEIQQELLNQKVGKQDITFAIDTMSKEAKHDKISIKQLFYGMASGFTKTVLHSNINSKNAGAGNHTVYYQNSVEPTTLSGAGNSNTAQFTYHFKVE
jgi:hypothetical protein